MNTPNGNVQLAFDNSGTDETGVVLPNMPMMPHVDQASRAYDPTRANNPGRKGGITSIDIASIPTPFFKQYDVAGNVLVITNSTAAGADASCEISFDDNRDARILINIAGGAGGVIPTKTIRVPTFGSFTIHAGAGGQTWRIVVMNDPNDGILGVF